ncbi:MAG: caspase family protein, partial [Bacteroidales bacterium]|nr:caspase family protein [Bacteroidales bacterium]
EVSIHYDLTTARYHALIIAVQDYDDPNINDLDDPIRDATRFFEVISSQYTFERDHILFLKNPTKADIIGTLHQMRNIMSPEDNLLIFYAGHGYWDEEMKTGYWLPRDADRNNPVNWLPNTDLTNYLNALKTKHTLLIADACFSGGIFKTRAAFSKPDAAIEKLYKLPSRKAITSGTLTEVPDKSVFTDFLIRRLYDNMEKYYTAEQLFSSLRVAVMNNSPNVPQYGTIQNVGDEGGDFVFILK